MWVPIYSGNHSGSCSENFGFRIAQVVGCHSENGILYSENGISNSESCSENTPELSQSSENGLFSPRAFFLKLGVVPRLLILMVLPHVCVGPLSGPFNRLNPTFSLSLCNAPSTAIPLRLQQNAFCDSECDFQALSRPKPLRRLNHARVTKWCYGVWSPLKTSTKQKCDRLRDSGQPLRPRLSSQPQGATKCGLVFLFPAILSLQPTS